MRTMSAILCAIGAAATFCANAFGAVFATGSLADYLENADSLKPEKAALVDNVQGANGKFCLRLGDNAEAKFKPFPISPGVKNTLSLRARFSGSEALEENPLFDELAKPQRWRMGIVPAYVIEFLDKGGAPISGKNLFGAMPGREWREYRRVFYPPDNAARMRLAVNSGKPAITCWADDIKLEKTPEQGAININPVSADHDLYDYSGWDSLALGSKRIMAEDGKVVFDSAYGSGGAPFPLHEPGTYRLYAKKRTTGYYSVVILRIYDQNKELTQMSIGRDNGADTYFILPPGTVRGGFLVYSSLLEEIRLNRVGDASKINEFTTKK